MNAISPRLEWLFTPRGRVTRGQYLLWGCILLAVWLGADMLMCRVMGVPWGPLPWWRASSWAYREVGVAGWLSLAILSLPFAWIGITLTLRRLRDAELNQWLVFVFVLPLFNLVLFALLSALPTARQPRTGVALHGPVARDPFSFGPVPALVAAVAIALLIGFSTQAMQTYGIGLFLGAPFLQGMLVGVLSRRRDGGVAFGQFWLSVLFSCVLMMAFAMEGMICILMAAPLWVLLGLAGLGLARLLVAVPARHIAPALLVVPVSQWAEPHLMPPPTVFEVSTGIVVNAPPSTIWPHLNASRLPPPTELPFLVGIAYPVASSTDGEGVGATRRCSFNTGDFVETIEVWDEPRRLVFSVQQSPPPMVEWNPLHDHVDAPHLHGTFLGHRGQFVLTDRGDGTTLLTGTTWYSHGLWPETYWSWWSDWLVHTIHRRVLSHIARCAEADVR